MITGKTKLLGVIGHPITHSLSPIMQNAALAHLGVDYVYVPLPVAPQNLEQAVAGFEAIALQGFNITIPHKQAIMPFLAELSPVAQTVGAVNTVWRSDRGWSGTNTDVVGFLAPLKQLERDWSTTEVLILGNGGAARAVVAGCAQLGCAAIHVAGRDRSKLEQFQQSWAQSPIPVQVQIHDWDALPQRISTAGLVVNTTPIGMHPQVNVSPLTPEVAQSLHPGAIAYDLIYVPQPTLFLQQAIGQGAIAIDGLEMLVQQGAAALEIWLQQPAPVEVMRFSLQQHLGLIKPSLSSS